MAKSDAGTPKHRVQIKVTDVATGEERISTDMVVDGIIRPGCCSCTNWVYDGGPVVDGPVLKQ